MHIAIIALIEQARNRTNRPKHGDSITKEAPRKSAGAAHSRAYKRAYKRAYNAHGTRGRAGGHAARRALPRRLGGAERVAIANKQCI